MVQVISIQSQLVYGHAGNSAAVFPMQWAGVPVLPVPTTLLSNNPHYETTYGRVLDSGMFTELLRGIEDRNIIDENTIILSGYLGSVENAEAMHGFLNRLRFQFPQIRYVCDPVMGDEDFRTFVPPELVNYFREVLVPIATLTTPNQYELELLTHGKARTKADFIGACEALHERGTKEIIVTGCTLDDSEIGTVESIYYQDTGLSRSVRRRLPIRPVGTGDLFTANVVAQMAKGFGLEAACEAATEDVFNVLCTTVELNKSELAVVENYSLKQRFSLSSLK